MSAQIITTPAGERLVLIPESEFQALVEAAEEQEDRATVAGFREAIAMGHEELVPASVVDRLLAGENRIKVWRNHRGLTMSTLARKAGIAQAFVSQIESGKREGTLETLRKIAAVLDVTLDDLAG